MSTLWNSCCTATALRYSTGLILEATHREALRSVEVIHAGNAAEVELGRFGVEMIDKNDLPKVMFKNKIHHQKAIYGMIADQSPKAQNIKHWTTFLGVETPVFVGAEVLAKRLDHNMCYM
ncbi:lysophospholipid acyltransferase family protein [Mesohalobacter halotolerans]|uniref:Uncharacterized protein n=1 Tax=Mesohalobacter halotolerans TaxID=1883405 RepID=A0A4U5TPM4_9FLAO|nr:hypothetical protein [Mesohalobacter halotolerans]TKS55832.1 hypothetical protein FCN74_07290 [Mesohalobacter halotolerans]